MKYLTVLSLFLISSCASKENSIFFENCQCHKFVLNPETKVTDRSGRFSVTFPDDSWNPLFYYDEFGTKLVGGKLDEGDEKIVIINEIYKFEKEFFSKEKQKQNSDLSYANKESGEIMLLGEECFWSLHYVYDNYPRMYSINIPLTEQSSDYFYSIIFLVQETKEYKERLCELESILTSLEIK